MELILYGKGPHSIWFGFSIDHNVKSFNHGFQPFMLYIFAKSSPCSSTQSPGIGFIFIIIMCELTRSVHNLSYHVLMMPVSLSCLPSFIVISCIISPWVWWCVCLSLVCCISLLGHLWRYSTVSDPVEFCFCLLTNFIWCSLYCCRWSFWSVVCCICHIEMHSGMLITMYTLLMLIFMSGISPSIMIPLL